MNARLPGFVLWMGGVIALVGAGSVASCGARTGLPVRGDRGLSPGADSGVLVDSGVLTDAEAALLDAPIVFDDTGTAPIPNDCPDGGDTLIYVVTESSTVYSFRPAMGQFTPIGVLSCPTPDPAWQPFSMAVDRQGKAYVLFRQGTAPPVPPGKLFRVSMATLACSSLPYVGGQDGFDTFGMGFVANVDAGTESLYVALNTDVDAGLAPELGVLDVTSFQLSSVKSIVPPTIASAELTGTGEGRLFAFYATDPGAQNASSAIAELDPATAISKGHDDLSLLPQQHGWAFAFWGGNFYLFTGDPAGSGSIVTRFNPSDKSQTTVATLPDLVVGAGVSTCAPQR